MNLDVKMKAIVLAAVFVIVTFTSDIELVPNLSASFAFYLGFYSFFDGGRSFRLTQQSFFLVRFSSDQIGVPL